MLLSGAYLKLLADELRQFVAERIAVDTYPYDLKLISLAVAVLNALGSLPSCATMPNA